jgi:hypothetical protein
MTDSEEVSARLLRAETERKLREQLKDQPKIALEIRKATGSKRRRKAHEN